MTEHELKIVVKYSEGKPAFPNNVLVSIDDEPIGLIKRLKFSVSIDRPAMLKVLFPDPAGNPQSLVEAVGRYAAKVKSLWGARVRVGGL